MKKRKNELEINSKNKSEAGGVQRLVIPPPQMHVMWVQLVGEPGVQLVVNNGREKLAQMLLEEPSGVKGRRKKRPPRDLEGQFQGSRYRIDKNTDGFPAGGIRSCIISTHSLLDTVTRKMAGSIRVSPEAELLPILDPKTGKPALAQKRDRDVVWVGNKAGPRTGNPDVRARAFYCPWMIRCRIIFPTALFDPESVLSMLAWAGATIGLGEGRSEKASSMQCGAFSVELIDPPKGS